MITGSGVSDSKLKRDYWYLTHKTLLRKILIVFLIFTDLALWVFATFFILQTYSFNGQSFDFSVNQLSNSVVNYSTFNRLNQPIPLQIGGIKVLRTSGGKYDLLINIQNTNQNWVGRASGKFIIGEHEYDSKIFSILPSESKYIIEAGVDSVDGVGSARFIFDKNQWQRISNKDVFSRFVKERYDFNVKNIIYKSPKDLELGSRTPVGEISFDILNNSLYDYWLVNNMILFKSGSEIIAINVVALDELRRGQRRMVDLRIFDNLSGTVSAEVKPDIDIFDETNFIEESLIVGQEK